jgi:hypothetical protein
MKIHQHELQNERQKTEKIHSKKQVIEGQKKSITAFKKS